MWCYLLVLLSLLMFVKGEIDWAATCPNYCRCKWVSGKKSTECTEANLQEIPRNLSAEVQSLNISGNPINKLPRHAFLNVNLVNIHKLYIRNCGLREIHEDAFEGLKILIELDLSDNHVRKLNSSTFKGMERLRVLLFNNNELVTIESGLLSNLKYLQRVEFSNNNLTSVSSSAFLNDEKLNYVVLNDNRLTHMDPIELRIGQNLSSLVLHNNRWKCDCKLKKFVYWTMQKNLYTPPTKCHEPESLHNRLWNTIDPEQFSCKPHIIEIGGPIVMSTDSTQSIICKVYGEPIPQVSWLLNNYPINPIKEKVYTIEESKSGGNIVLVNLTIKNPAKRDKGGLVCSAINPGGIEQKNVSFIVKPGGLINGVENSTLLTWSILCIVFIVIFVFICVILLCYCFGRRKKTLLKHDMNTSNGSAPTDESDPQKSLITEVNPVEKPPRRTEAAPSVASYGTEMSEINRTLLGNESVFGPASEMDEESRSLDYVDHKPKHVKDRLPSDFLRSERPYPPDLLSFPPRSSQISPAGSCASTIPDHFRAIPSHQSPIHSPIYNTLPNSNISRTLPHSRSQSPFTSPGYVPVQSRQGYITIPRRPRVPSWSAPSSTNGSEIVEPVYDNLGLRTTANGSSMLSLNKSVEASPVGIRNRPLPTTPITPVYQKNGLPTNYAPIEEHESPPAPCPTQHQNSQMGTLPKSPISPYSSLEHADYEGWIAGPNRDSVNLGILSPTDNSLRNQLSPSLLTNSIPGRIPKVPPKPPPKPKNKSSINCTLFEDEGEDGTEV